MRVALDTNVLAYAEGLGDAERCAAAVQLIGQLPAEDVLLPAQTLGELHRLLVSKGKQPAQIARDIVLSWSDSFAVADSTWPTFQAAFDLAADHGLQIWDALILAVAAENRCRLLLSEDLHAGFVWRGVTVVNPFAAMRHHLLAVMLKQE